MELEIQIDRGSGQEGIFRSAKTSRLIGDITHFAAEEEFPSDLEIDTIQAMGNWFLGRSRYSQE